MRAASAALQSHQIKPLGAKLRQKVSPHARPVGVALSATPTATAAATFSLAAANRVGRAGPSLLQAGRLRQHQGHLASCQVPMWS